MRIILKGFAAATILILLTGAPEAKTKMPAVFDKPMNTQVVPPAEEPGNPYQKEPKRSCYYYPNFMVKEADTGQKGADELAIMRRGDSSGIYTGPVHPFLDGNGRVVAYGVMGSCFPVSSARSHARAILKSRFTVSTETSRTSAVSSMLRPPK